MRLLDRWRIARHIEDGRELPSALSRRVTETPALSKYCSRLRRTERALRDVPPLDAAPAGLAADVMRRIARAERPGPSAWPRRVWAAPALAAILLAGAVLYVLAPWSPQSPPPAPQPASIWQAADWASELGRGRAPVGEPLVREARLLARDTRRAADMVLASFPSARPAGR